MSDLVLKRGDNRTCIKAILKNASGAVVDLTGCQVQFYMKALNRVFTLSRTAHIENAVGGEVWVVWQYGDTFTTGDYRAEFEVTFDDGKIETYPNTGYISIQIIDDLM